MTSTAGAQNTSAHVCTDNASPAIQRNGTWLRAAAEERQASETLHKQYLRLKKSALADASWAGHYALRTNALIDERIAIKGGALLHISVPAAITLATACLKQRGVLA